MGKPNLGQAMPSNGAYSSDVKYVKNLKSVLKVLTVNVRGVECVGRLDQIQQLLVKNLVSVAVLTETETTHLTAASSNINGFKAFCPPTCVTGPPGKEVGVILLISEKLASASKPRPDLNSNDTIQTVWTITY